MSKIVFLKSVSLSYLRQLVTLVVGVATVPLLLNYFGSSLFGLWMLIYGLSGYLNTVSFGIPSAMSTLVAKSLSLENKYCILQKSVWLLVIIVAGVLGVFLFAINYDNSWVIPLLGNIDEEYKEVIKDVFILFVIVTLIKIPLNMYIQFFVGLNKVYIAEIYQISNILIGFLFLLVTIYFQCSFYTFTLLTVCAQAVVGIIATLHVMIRFHFLRLSENIHSSISNREILHSGFAFFQVGIAASIVWSTDNLVINHFLSSDFVTPYTIAFKIFTYIFIFSAIINGVAGPIYGQACAENNFEKIRIYATTILKVLSVIGGYVWFSLLFFAKEVIILWAGNEQAFGGYLLIFSLGFYGFVLSFVNTYSTIILSLNYANKTLRIAWSEAILNFVLSISLIRFLGIGGVALATALSSLLTGGIFLPKAIAKLTYEKISFEYSYCRKHFFILLLPAIIIALISIYIDIFSIKAVIYMILCIFYFIFSWKFLDKQDKEIFINILRKRSMH